MDGEVAQSMGWPLLFCLCIRVCFSVKEEDLCNRKILFHFPAAFSVTELDRTVVIPLAST